MKIKRVIALCLAAAMFTTQPSALPSNINHAQATPLDENRATLQYMENLFETNCGADFLGEAIASSKGTQRGYTKKTCREIQEKIRSIISKLDQEKNAQTVKTIFKESCSVDPWGLVSTTKKGFDSGYTNSTCVRMRNTINDLAESMCQLALKETPKK